MKRIKYLFIFLLFTFSSQASPTLGLSVGYNGSVFGNGVKNIRNEVYLLNHFDYPNLAKPFEFSNFFRGLNVDLIFNQGEENEFFYFISWTQRLNFFSGSGTVDGADFEMKIKHRFNNLTFTGFGYRAKKWAFAVSPVNIGIYQAKYKSTAEVDGDNWKDYYNISKGVVSSNIGSGSAMYIDYYFTPHFRARAEGYYDWYGVTMRNRENILINYKFTTTSLSLSLSYVLFKE
jgi:hypothetical protein